MRIQQTREEQAVPVETNTPPIVERGESSVHCFVCQQPGHYATQCPRHKGKEPTINTIMAEVQQVTTWQHAKNKKWAEQDKIRKAAQAWVEKANAVNAERMKQESMNASLQTNDNVLAPDPIWQALADCEITLTMDKLLRLVPRFRQVVENRIRGTTGLDVSTNFAESSTGPTVVDHHNPAIKLVLKGQEISGCIVDRGSRVNVIVQARILDWALQIGKHALSGST